MITKDPVKEKVEQAERARIQKQRQETMDYNRLNQKPLIYGMEEFISYPHHSNEVTGFCENLNNQINVTYNQKEMHFWDRDSGKKQRGIKIAEMSRSHTTVSTISFSHKYRLYLAVTADFRMFFINENLNVVQMIDMSSIRLVNFAVFNDKDDQLIVGGINGVFVYDFNYKSKYSPQLAATIDVEGKHISIQLDN